MDERAVVELVGVGSARRVCDRIIRTARSMRGNYGVQGLNAYEVTLKYLMGKKRIPWKVGEALLADLSERTVQALLRVAGTEKTEVWLL